MAKVTELVAALAAPIAEQNGCTLWDVEYVREAGSGSCGCISTSRRGSPSTTARR